VAFLLNSVNGRLSLLHIAFSDDLADLLYFLTKASVVWQLLIVRSEIEVFS